MLLEKVPSVILQYEERYIHEEKNRSMPPFVIRSQLSRKLKRKIEGMDID
jgi:hypothetical protein